ncbi:MAG: DUF2284 domain-containing protein [Clostridia bacterium]|nr:DUF2284 domain-containing protein [Clostridia bacterium]
MIKKAIIDSGAFACGEVPINEINFYDDIRAICEGNGCRVYGKTWVCPPAIGTVEECRERVNSYQRAILFNAVYELEDSFDIEGMDDARLEFRKLCEDVRAALLPIIPDHRLLANGGCSRCEKCSYPDAPCRFPDTAFQALEGYGVIVSELAKQAGIKYINGRDTVTYFAMILYNE